MSTSDEDKLLIEEKVNGNTFPLSIHFGAISWGCGFYVGVHKAMEEEWGVGFKDRIVSVSGDSAGVLFCVGIAIGRTADQMNFLYKNLSERCAKEGLSKNSEIVDEGKNLLFFYSSFLLPSS